MLYNFISLDDLFARLTNEETCVIEAGSVKKITPGEFPEICYFVNLKTVSISETFIIHEMGDMGLGGEIANQKRLPHMQFAIQTAEFLYKSVQLHAFMNQKNISLSLKFRMGMPVTGMTFHENWDMFFT